MGKAIRLDKLLSSLGYCSRSGVHALLREDRVKSRSNEGGRLSVSSQVEYSDILLDGEPLDPPAGIVAALHKLPGYSCTRASDEGLTIYDKLPPRWVQRNPPVVSAGRLDKETEGLLIVTDDGEMVHKLTSPKKEVEKVYEVWLRDPLRGDEAKAFASGELMIEGEDEPLKPAKFKPLGDNHAEVIITEGRYHQVRLMFEAVGNFVTRLVRTRIGNFKLEGLAPGEFRILSATEIKDLFG